MSVLNGNNPVHRGRTLRQTNHGRTGTKEKTTSTSDPGIIPNFTNPRTAEGPPNWLALAVTTLASAPLGWFAAGRVLRPLRTITDTARTISAGNLHERLALAGPEDEFKRLGDTLDDLLSRLEAAFVAHASHELRTL